MQHKLHIAVNARLMLSGKLEGIGYFAYEALMRITKQNPDVNFTFLFDRAYSNEFIYSKNVTPVVLFPQARHPLLYLWWFEGSVANWLNKHQPDLFLSPDGYGVLRSNVPQLLVMHDIAFEHFPKHNNWLQTQYYKKFMPLFAAHAARIATVSAFSKQDIATHYAISPDKIDVVYNGVRAHFSPQSEDVKQKARERFSSGKKYFVCVGSVNPRKNLANVLRAFDVFKQQSGSDIKLIIAGAKGWKAGPIFEVFKHIKFKSDVVFTDRLSDEDLLQVIAAAEASLYVSLFEGFGVPPLEAMACGVPVITSNVSSMPEICGDAALYVYPEKVNDIAAKMNAIIDNEHLKADLIHKGLAHYKQYTWQRTADLLWGSCQKALNVYGY